MSFFSDIKMAINLWSKYGNLAEKGIAIVEDLEAIDAGKFGDEVDAVLKKHGIDISAIVSAASNLAPAKKAPVDADSPSDQQPSEPYAGAGGKSMYTGVATSK